MHIKSGEMFIQDDKTITVPHCKDCGSQNIYTIQTCRDCGSSNIVNNYVNTRGKEVTYNQINSNTYKCDICGTQYMTIGEEDRISDKLCYDDGFLFWHKSYNDEQAKNVLYTIEEQDVCPKCKEKILKQIKEQLDTVVNSTNIIQIIESMKPKVENNESEDEGTAPETQEPENEQENTPL